MTCSTFIELRGESSPRATSSSLVTTVSTTRPNQTLSSVGDLSDLHLFGCTLTAFRYNFASCRSFLLFILIHRSGEAGRRHRLGCNRRCVRQRDCEFVPNATFSPSHRHSAQLLFLLSLLLLIRSCLISAMRDVCVD